MALASGSPAASEAPADGYFAGLRARVDGFTQRHFTWPGTLRLHRAAFGRDVLLAPVNVALAPVLVLARLTAWLFRRLGLRRASAWLGSRRILLRTSVAGLIEALIVTDLMGLALPEGSTAANPRALTRAVLSAPQFRARFRKQGSVAEAEALAARITGALGEYSGTRSAVAEMTTALLTLVVGALVFRALTPGMISFAPDLAGAVARNTAISEFPLGSAIGGMWYGLFSVGTPGWLIGAALAAMVMLGSVVAAFAGVLADPVQVRLGIHRRRLLRLIATLEADLTGAGETPFATNEHYLARAMDVWDAALTLLRALRS